MKFRSCHTGFASSMYSVSQVKFIYFIGLCDSSAPALFACHRLFPLSVTCHISGFCRSEASSVVKRSYFHWSLRLSVKYVPPWDWISLGATPPSAVPVSLWEASPSCSTSSSRPFHPAPRKEGRTAQAACVTSSVPQKTVLLCDFLGLFSLFCSRWEVRLEGLES